MRSTALGDTNFHQINSSPFLPHRLKEKIILPFWVLINCSKIQNWQSREKRKWRMRGGRACRGSSREHWASFTENRGRRQKNVKKRGARKKNIKNEEKVTVSGKHWSFKKYVSKLREASRSHGLNIDRSLIFDQIQGYDITNGGLYSLPAL